VKLLYVAIGIVGWGALALLVLAMAIARARVRDIRPIPREEALTTTCSRCRLPFHRSSWKCGRCGAYLKPRLFYWIGKFVLEPLLTALIVPWIMAVGLIMSTGLWLMSRFAPLLVPLLTRITNRLGVWVAPLFGRWVPEQWRIPIEGTTLLPNEVDAPEDAIVAASLTVGTALLERREEGLEIWVPQPGEETLEMLRRTRGGIREIWGYISDGHTLVPSFTDKIIGAVCRGDDLVEYTDGLTNHLQAPLSQFEVQQIVRKPEGRGRRRRRRRRRRRPGQEQHKERGGTGAREKPVESPGSVNRAEPHSEWKFVLRREPDEHGRFPIRWEVHAEPNVLLAMHDRVTELESWNTLPCGLVIDRIS
jgi:hypothetical protein